MHPKVFMVRWLSGTPHLAKGPTGPETPKFKVSKSNSRSQFGGPQSNEKVTKKKKLTKTGEIELPIILKSLSYFVVTLGSTPQSHF